MSFAKTIIVLPSLLSVIWSLVNIVGEHNLRVRSRGPVNETKNLYQGAVPEKSDICRRLHVLEKTVFDCNTISIG